MHHSNLSYGDMPNNWKTKSLTSEMRYTPLTDHNSSVPKWLSATLKKAVHPDPKHRYEELSEFLHDFRYPNPELSTEDHRPLLERNPVKFWQGLSIILMGIVIYLIGILPNG